MKVIGPSNMLHVNVAGRDIIEVPERRVVASVVNQIRYPMTWFKPRPSSTGLSFGYGFAPHAGVIPTNHDSVFSFSNRICLIETLTPFGELTTGTTGSGDMFALVATSVGRQARLGTVPSPYQSTTSVLKEGFGDPEIRITVLGYLHPERGLAIAEKIRFYNDVIPLSDYVQISRYPYVLPSFSVDRIASDGASAEKFYYTEAEILEDL